MLEERIRMIYPNEKEDKYSRKDVLIHWALKYKNWKCFLEKTSDPNESPLGGQNLKQRKYFLLIHTRGRFQ